MNENIESYRCVIIGADAAGLETAHEMIKKGIRPLVIDLSEELERKALSIEYGLRPYFKEPEISERINEITGNIQHIMIKTAENRWSISVTRDDIMGGREYKLRSLFRDVVTAGNVQIEDNLDYIILTKDQKRYRITAIKNGIEKDYTPDLTIITNRDIAEKNGIIDLSGKQYYTSIESDFENVYGREGNLEYFYTHDILSPGGYILIEQITSSRAHITFRFSSESRASAEINDRNYMDWIMDNISIATDRLATAGQISDTIVAKKYLYDEKNPISGTGFLLAGDAANISEPLFGNSYPYNLYSGKLAAYIAESAFESGDFSADFLSNYDTMLRRTISPVVKSFQAAKDQIFSSVDKLNEFIGDVNRNSDTGNERFVESMFKYLYRKGLLRDKS